MARLTRYDFERLLEFRVTLRRFECWSEDQAYAAGLTPVQHQLLVAIKGHPADKPPAVRDLAGYLLLRPHSTVELIGRAETAGLVRRRADLAGAIGAEGLVGQPLNRCSGDSRVSPCRSRIVRVAASCGLLQPSVVVMAGRRRNRAPRA
jgi:MarR family protein